MTRTKYPDEFKEQVVREILEKERTIASVAASYDLVPQTVGGWVAKYKKKHAEDQDPEAAAESAEIARLRAERRELRAEMRVLEKRLPSSRENVGERAPQGSSAAKKAITPSPPCANWSEYRSPATCDWLGRPEAATKVRRRKLALLVESEFKASDMILRVPAPRRRSEAQGHRRVPRHASAPPSCGRRAR